MNPESCNSIDRSKDSYPRYFNEWMNNLMDKINKDDNHSSQISTFMVGLMQCPWEKVKSVTLDYKEYGTYVSDIKPYVKVEFK